MQTKENMYDFKWVLALFGTAVGAGILFLPIRAGTSGVIPIIFMTLIIFPMVWISHRALARLVVSSDKNHNLLEVTESYFGKSSSKIVSVLYFFAIYPICLAYGVGITNTVSSFFENQLGILGVPRSLIAVVFISLMMFVMVNSRAFMMKIMQIMVYPLVTILFLFSIYLIPQWNVSANIVTPSTSDFLIAIWLTLPVLVFAFNHSPAISSFALEIKKKYGDNAGKKIDKISLHTSLMLTFFIMFFVFSVVFTLTQEQLLEARAQNISILSYVANLFDSNLISFTVPFVAFFAIVSSFFGHYLGAHEGLVKITSFYSSDNQKISKFSTAFIYLSMIIVAIINPSILDLIETLGGPIIAIILFLFPIYATYKIESLKKYKNTVADIFILVTALFTITSIIYKLF